MRAMLVNDHQRCAVPQIRTRGAISCEDPSEMDAVIGEMIKAGEISESDRVHCVHWEVAKPDPGTMTNEERLKFLD